MAGRVAPTRRMTASGLAYPFVVSEADARIDP